MVTTQLDSTPGDADLSRADSLAREIFSDVANKWAFLIIETLGENTLRFSELRTAVEGIKGVDPKLAKDPVINISDAKIEGYESQIETAKGLQQRNRAYTEFKAA